MSRVVICVGTLKNGLFGTPPLSHGYSISVTWKQESLVRFKDIPCQGTGGIAEGQSAYLSYTRLSV